MTTRTTITDSTKQIHVAYHEAGHAAIHWMFGTLSDLEFIDMQGTAAVWAFVRARRWDMLQLLDVIPWDGRTRRLWELLAQQSVMHDLAGYAAQSRVDPALGGDWFDRLLAEGGWEHVEDHDVNRAVRVSKALRGDNGDGWQFLRRMAFWTDEALNHPWLWAVVEALAERLQTVKTRISGGQAVDIMAKAWPWAGDKLPFVEMGQEWRRRFAVEV
jgi:hypothetical protein